VLSYTRPYSLSAPPQVNKAKRVLEPAAADARSSHTDDDDSGDEVDDHSAVGAEQADDIDLTVRGVASVA
jgi:hypothetical protein